VARVWAGSLLDARVVGCWCGCLSGARCRQLYDLHINSMSYTLFLFQIISFKKYFCVSLGNNFYCFLWRPVVESPGQLPSLPPPQSPALNPTLLYSKSHCPQGDAALCHASLTVIIIIIIIMHRLTRHVSVINMTNRRRSLVQKTSH